MSLSIHTIYVDFVKSNQKLYTKRDKSTTMYFNNVETQVSASVYKFLKAFHFAALSLVIKEPALKNELCFMTESKKNWMIENLNDMFVDVARYFFHKNNKSFNMSAEDFYLLEKLVSSYEVGTKINLENL